MTEKAGGFKQKIKKLFERLHRKEKGSESAVILGRDAYYSPLVCAELLSAFKAQFQNEGSSYYDFFMVFETLTAALQKFPQFAGEILEIAAIILQKYERTSAGLIINIVHTAPDFSDKAALLLEDWLKAEKYDEGALVNLYQFLALFLEAHLEQADFARKIAEAALISTKNKKYALREAANLMQRINELI